MTKSPKHPTAEGKLKLYLLLGGMLGGGILGVIVVSIVLLFRGQTEVNVAGDSTGIEASVPGTKAQADSSLQVETMADAGAPNGSAQDPARLAALVTPKEDYKEITEKLRKIGLAFHNFHDTHQVFALPRQADVEVSQRGRREQPTELSWRVHLLPFVEQKPLYDQFHLDEPWDSPHNKTLLDKMPEVYRIGSSDASSTRFQVATGSNMLFGNQRRAHFSALSDGSPHTILVMVSGIDRGIPWTRPDDLVLDRQNPVASLGTLPDKLIYAVTADVKPLVMHDDISGDTLLALATPGGKEIVDAGTLRRKFEDARWKVLAQQAVKNAGSDVPSAATSGTESPAATFQMFAQKRIIRDRSDKLKRIVLAMHNYSDTFRQLPPSKNAKHFAADGQPFLSWRVHLLNFLDQSPLFDQFRMNEPWDSPHNITLLHRMPDIFLDPEDEIGSTSTRFVTFTGAETPYAQAEGLRMRDFIDGSSETLLIVAAGADKAVPWTKPQDLPFDPNAPLDGLGQLTEPGIFYARVDGAVKVLKSDVPAELFKAIVTPNGRETLPKDFQSFHVR